VSFDFDDTISTQRGQDIAKRLISEGKTVYIVTRRQESASEEVYKVADELGIPHSRIYFTNGALKWETIKRLGIDTHYDNNENEVNKIRENTDAKAIKF
jgi:NAD(P)-dependent dehydrogenase (short-subunit alcohol dehydrogenase family)